MLFNLSDAWAQSAEPRTAEGQIETKPLKIGDTISEEIWDMPLQTVKHGRETKEIRLADYRGKVIIFDYWATWCKSCINAMPRMHELAQAYPYDVVLLPVTHESASLITAYLPKTRSEQIRTLLHSFETIVDGQPLKDLIPHQTIPHIAIINSDGILEQTTMPHLLNEDVIGKIVRGEDYDIPVYRGEMESTVLSPTYEDVKLVKPYYYSTLTGYLNGFQNDFREWVDSTNMVKRGHYINKPLITLFLAALQPEFNILMPNRRIMLMDDPKAVDYFHERNPEYLRSESNVCYEYALPDTWTEAQIRNRMLSDLQDLTGFHARIVSVEVPCTILKPSGKLITQKQKTQSSGIVVDEILVSARVPEHVGPTEGGAKNYLRSTGIDGFVYYMNTAKKGAVPFMINETEIGYPIDLDLPDNLYDIDKMKYTLSEQGIEVVKEIRKLDMFVMAEGPIEKLPAIADLKLGKFGYVVRKEGNDD